MSFDPKFIRVMSGQRIDPLFLDHSNVSRGAGIGSMPVRTT